MAGGDEASSKRLTGKTSGAGNPPPPQSAKRARHAGFAVRGDQAALAEEVGFVPGDSSYADKGQEGGRHMRLNFSYCQPELIHEGIRRLSVAVKMQLQLI
jgi:hypothetical protein